jgi:superfamily I DNA/RNA helicase
LRAANAVISHNSRREKKEMFSQNGDGEKISILKCRDERAEANEIFERILKMRAASFAGENKNVIPENSEGIYPGSGNDSAEQKLNSDPGYFSSKNSGATRLNFFGKNLNPADSRLRGNDNPDELTPEISRGLTEEENSEKMKATFANVAFGGVSDSQNLPLTTCNLQLEFSNFAILYRTNAQSRALEEAALRFSIPYKITGGVKFYARREIKDLLSFLRFLQNPADEVSFLRIVNLPPRKIGKTTIARLSNFAAQKNLTLGEILPHVSHAEGITPRAILALKNFAAGCDSLRVNPRDISGVKNEISAGDLLEKICEKFNLENFYRDGTEEGEMRWENIRELVSVARAKFDGVENSVALFLEEVALISEADSVDEKANSVSLMTLHNAKGLEFPVVFVAGIEEKILPHARSSFSPAEVEEERRLFYVGITRAREKLFLTFAKSRYSFGDFS